MKILHSTFYILNSNKGVSLYLATLILSVLLALSLGISAILYGQIKVMKGMGNSVIAFYAANTGIEKVLYIDKQTCISEPTLDERITCLKNEVSNIPPGDLILDNGASYELTIDAYGEGTCPVDKNYCAKAVGVFQETRRAIRVAR